jgi:hypothetical protein
LGAKGRWGPSRTFATGPDFFGRVRIRAAPLPSARCGFERLELVEEGLRQVVDALEVGAKLRQLLRDGRHVDASAPIGVRSASTVPSRRRTIQSSTRMLSPKPGHMNRPSSSLRNQLT